MMYVGLGGPPDLPGMDPKGLAWARVVASGTAHSEAVRRALEAAEEANGQAPRSCLDEILKAAGQLDQHLTIARNCGWTAGELAKASGLHPSYVEELERWESGNNWI